MTAKRLSIWIGGAVAVVAAFALATTVPTVADPGKRTVAHLEANAAPEPGNCAQLTFDATFTYTVQRPMLDLWGFAEVRDLNVDHVTEAASTIPDCTAEPVNQLTAWIILPACDRAFSDASSLVQQGLFTECDRNAVAYATDTSDEARGVKMTFEGGTDLSDSGLIRDTWCPEFANSLSYGSTSTDAQVVSGDLCLDLS